MQRRNENNEPTYHQLGHGDDLRLNHSNYHAVSNPSNKDWWDFFILMKLFYLFLIQKFPNSFIPYFTGHFGDHLP